MGIAVSFVALLLIILLLQGHRNERAIAREWEMILEPWAAQRLETAHQVIESQAGMVDRVYEMASDAWRAESHDEAQARLAAGLRLVESTTTRLSRFLAGVATLSRMVDAVAPTAPLQAADFRDVKISSLAALGQIFHHLLVTTGERLRLRAWILRKSLPILVRSFKRAGEQREWKRIRAAREDLKTTSAETLRNALISIEHLSILEGELPQGILDNVRSWAGENREALRVNWRKASRGEPLDRIHEGG